MVGGDSGASGSGGEPTGRAQADRWLVASEKLLASNDLPGARTFAIRACGADPTRAQAADYILAICDVLLAAETRLGNDPSSKTLQDWYAVLRLGRLAQNPEHVATQYRRLSLLLNPTVNRLPFADRAFKIVSDAWFVLSDPSRKSVYDRELQPESTRAATWQSQVLNDPTATSFWTACPYCYVLFEYEKCYEECTLKCQECRRAFQAVVIEKPPVEGKGEDVYFNTWVMYPLGFSGEFRAPQSWSPISPLFACPLQMVEATEGNVKKRKEPAPPRIYYDDDDIYVAISDDDGEGGDDGEWREEVQVSKKGKGKETVVRSSKKGIGNVESGSALNGGSVGGSSSGVMAKTVSNGTRKRTGAGGKNVGRLDLNVEFSNEVEDGRNEGNGFGANREVDNMEGIGFFEGLDEFLSSLPILSVVGDDKIKAT